MKIYKFNSLIIKDKMKLHDQIKSDLLNLINDAKDLSFKKKDDEPSLFDSICEGMCGT